MCVDLFACPEFALNNVMCNSHDVGDVKKNVRGGGGALDFSHLHDTAP